jgi:hypothetical protein
MFNAETQSSQRNAGFGLRRLKADLFRAAVGSRRFWALLLVVSLYSGCATTPQPHVALTGNILVDGPKMIAEGPPKDKVLWEYRTAAAAMRVGDYPLAKRYLDDALLTLGGIYGNDPDAKKARSYFHAESKKTFIGEPYERSMAYFYRGVIYWMDGELDNARACFKSAEFEDSDAENKTYAGDWVLFDYLDGLATTMLGGDGSDAYKRAQANCKGVKLPPYNPKENVLFLLEYGPGPVKFRTGQYGEELRFRTVPSPVRSAELQIESLKLPIAPTDDVNFQATTRGGRVMDHILGNKAVFKSTTETAGNVALIGGLATAAASDNRTAKNVGLGIALAGLVTKLVSSATTPEADIRSWDNLPQFLSFACVSVPVGRHTATIEFLGGDGKPIANLTKTINLNVTTTDRDKVVFVSDTSTTPQTL